MPDNCKRVHSYLSRFFACNSFFPDLKNWHTIIPSLSPIRRLPLFTLLSAQFFAVQLFSSGQKNGGKGKVPLPLSKFPSRFSPFDATYGNHRKTNPDRRCLRLHSNVFCDNADVNKKLETRKYCSPYILLLLYTNDHPFFLFMPRIFNK